MHGSNLSAKAVVRIFELYALEDQTFESLKKRLRSEGYIYRKTNPTFNKSTLNYILNNRFYIGELTWRGELYPGKHKPIISRALFNACQDILKGRNRRTSCPTIPYSGGAVRLSLLRTGDHRRADPPEAGQRRRPRPLLLQMPEHKRAGSSASTLEAG